MVRSELVSRLMRRNPHLTSRVAALLVDTIFNEIAVAVIGSSYVVLETSPQERGLRGLAEIPVPALKSTWRINALRISSPASECARCPAADPHH